MNEHVKTRRNKGGNYEKIKKIIRRNDSIIWESFTNRTDYGRCSR